MPPYKHKLHAHHYGRTKPGTLLKHHIPIQAGRWDVTTPGFGEIDLVAHCGPRLDGEHCWALNFTALATTWVETQAVLGRHQRGVHQAIDDIAQALPFALRGLDSDVNDLYRHEWRLMVAMEEEAALGIAGRPVGPHFWVRRRARQGPQGVECLDQAVAQTDDLLPRDLRVPRACTSPLTRVAASPTISRSLTSARVNIRLASRSPLVLPVVMAIASRA